MSGAIISLVVVYVAVTIVVAFTGWSNWSIARDMQLSYEDDTDALPHYLGSDFIKRQRAKYERESLEGARLFRQSPLWPLLALGVLAQLINDSRKDTTP